MRDELVVIGAGGFVGSHLVKALLAKGEKVIALTQKPLDETADGLENQVLSHLDVAQLTRLVDRSRCVVHLASTSTPGSTASHPLRELSGNLALTLSLLEAMQHRNDVPLVYLSSGGSLYDGTQANPVSESGAIHPRSYHGAGKAAAEYFISAWCAQYQANATLIRPANVYGPGQKARQGFGIIPTAFDKICKDEVLHVWGDGSTVRDYLYIDDLVALCTDIIAQPRTTGAQVVNASSGVGTSLNELFSLVERVSSRPLKLTFDASRTVDAPWTVLDYSLAHRMYGWRPTINLVEGLQRTWHWFSTSRP
jgi:UDP-glucose 4-epimerase